MTISFQATAKDAEGNEKTQSVTGWHVSADDPENPGQYVGTGEIAFAGTPANFKISADDAERLAKYIRGDVEPPAIPSSDGSEKVDLDNLPDKEPANGVTEDAPAKAPKATAAK